MIKKRWPDGAEGHSTLFEVVANDNATKLVESKIDHLSFFKGESEGKTLITSVPPTFVATDRLNKDSELSAKWSEMHSEMAEINIAFGSLNSEYRRIFLTGTICERMSDGGMKVHQQVVVEGVSAHTSLGSVTVTADGEGQSAQTNLHELSLLRLMPTNEAAKYIAGRLSIRPFEGNIIRLALETIDAQAKLRLARYATKGRQPQDDTNWARLPLCPSAVHDLRETLNQCYMHSPFAEPINGGKKDFTEITLTECHRRVVALFRWWIDQLD